MNIENIKNKVQEYITEVDRKRVNEGFFDIDKARKVWTYDKLAELELSIEALEGVREVPKEVVDEKPKLVGHLTKAQGIKGYRTAEVGHKVFETKDRYLIYLKEIFTDKILPIYYYKDDFKKVIKFI